jgi:hypothetical protein
VEGGSAARRIGRRIGKGKGSKGADRRVKEGKNLDSGNVRLD